MRDSEALVQARPDTAQGLLLVGPPDNVSMQPDQCAPHLSDLSMAS
jgi:hypothetical protein